MHGATLLPDLLRALQSPGISHRDCPTLLPAQAALLPSEDARRELHDIQGKIETYLPLCIAYTQDLNHDIDGHIHQTRPLS
jgi:hypothetical protein